MRTVAVARLVLITVAAFVALSVATPSEAQVGWYPYRYYSGATSFIYGTHGQSFLRTFAWPDDIGYGPVTLNPGDTETIDANGTITVEWRWEDGQGHLVQDPPPPPKMYIIESARAGWTGYAATPEDFLFVTATGSADNGIGTPYVESTSELGYSGEANGFRTVEVDSSSGVISRSATMKAHTDMSFDQAASHYGLSDASCVFDVNFTAPADDYQFQDYPNPPPTGTTPYAQNAADMQSKLSDGTGYYTQGRVYTNQTEWHALTQLQETAVYFCFGHGGSSFQACETFYTTGQLWNWGAIVEHAQGSTDLQAMGMPAANIVVLEDPGLAPNAFDQVLLAVLEGCFTGASSTWGNPAHGIYAKGADCTVGWTVEIFSHGVDANGNPVAGAEEWADAFWKSLQSGNTVSTALAVADNAVPVLRMGLRNHTAYGDAAHIKITPARYGQ